jgi:hypothetical protein
MIIRLSSKLAEKVKVPLNQTLEADANPFTDWSANLFRIGNVQYIIVTNTASLYSVLFEGRGITTADKLLTSFLHNIEALLQRDEHRTAFGQFIKPLADDIHFSKALNSSVIGSMVDLVHLAEHRITDGEPLLEVSSRINEAPMSYLKYESPDRVMNRMIEERRGIA